MKHGGIGRTLSDLFATDQVHHSSLPQKGALLTYQGFAGVWDYQQTHGLGLMEYLEWAEDMNLHISEYITHHSPDQ